MSPARLFIERPIATTLLVVATLLLGIVAYTALPIAALPAVDRPTIVVSAPLPGASADTVATALAQPLEKQLGIIPGIIEMSSWSAPGGTEIFLQFDLSKDLDAAAGEVQAAINAAGPYLPKNWAWPPSYFKANPAGAPVIALAMTSDTIAPSELYDLADTLLSPKLSQLDGVARVNISGAERSAVRVQVSPGRVADMNVSLELIRTAIVKASQNLPKGAVDIGGMNATITANDQLLQAADYRNVVVAWRNHSPILLRDVANVTTSVINDKLDGWYNGEKGVVLLVYKQPDANVVATVDAVKGALGQVERWLPPAVKVHAVFDRTTLIRAAIAEVQRTIAIAIALVVLVILLFLRRFWATLIPALAIPVALAATLVVMQLNGYSLDNLTLMALTIAVGFVVDDAVIVIENIIRRVDEGEAAPQAALAGVRQMGFTIASITAALGAALIPVLFMPDVVGRYFREFGITLVVAVTASAVVSLTLTPMLCSRLLVHRIPGATKPSATIFASAYARSLDWALRHRIAALTVTIAATGATFWLYVTLPKGFMPTQDTGVMFVRTFANPNISFAAMETLQRTVNARILKDPAVSGLISWIGEGDGNALSTGQLTVALKPPEIRQQTIQQVIQRLRQSLAGVDGIRTVFIPMQDLNLGVQTGGARYQYEIWGADADQVVQAGAEMLRRFRALPGLTDIVPSWELSGLKAGVAVDRQRAAMFGITSVAVDNVLYDAFGQAQINLLYLPTNYSRVIMEVDPATQTDPSMFQSLYVPGTHGNQVPLAALTHPWRSHALMWERHSGQFPAAIISFDVKPGVSIGQAIDAINQQQAAAHLSDEVKAQFRGEAAAAADSNSARIFLFIAAVITAYIVLGVLYESYVHPLTILSTLPSTAFGALLAIRLTGQTFTLVTSIACILVVGMVMKNAIMMVDFALDAERRQHLSAVQSISLAARGRARPIVMTMLASVLSAVPLALGTGPGYELRQPLGITVVGGLLVAQLFTLYTTPVIYLLIDQLAPHGRQIRHQQL